jgi:Tfp pilus assembly protein PilW
MRIQRGQSLVEFGLTVGLLMVLVVATAQVAIFLFYRSALQLAAQEGAFEASLVGHTPADASTTTHELWTRLIPNAGPVRVTVTSQGNLIVVSAQAAAPALVPVPVPPFTSLPVTVHATHTLERFRPGSAP